MRLWSINPSYLDQKGLVALWREGLLAFHVLQGKTKGYTHHPQLERFSASQSPIKTIAFYLHCVVDEADQRGYSFDRTKLHLFEPVNKIEVTKGQLVYELGHLKQKLLVRDPQKYQQLVSLTEPEVHPLFQIVEGPIETWERLKVK